MNPVRRAITALVTAGAVFSLAACATSGSRNTPAARPQLRADMARLAAAIAADRTADARAALSRLNSDLQQARAAATIDPAQAGRIHAAIVAIGRDLAGVSTPAPAPATHPAPERRDDRRGRGHGSGDDGGSGDGGRGPGPGGDSN